MDSFRAPDGPRPASFLPASPHFLSAIDERCCFEGNRARRKAKQKPGGTLGRDDSVNDLPGWEGAEGFKGVSGIQPLAPVDWYLYFRFARRGRYGGPAIRESVSEVQDGREAKGWGVLFGYRWRALLTTLFFRFQLYTNPPSPLHPTLSLSLACSLFSLLPLQTYTCGVNMDLGGGTKWEHPSDPSDLSRSLWLRRSSRPRSPSRSP